MIERFHTTARMSRIVRHNGTIWLCGQVGAGATVGEETGNIAVVGQQVNLPAGSTVKAGEQRAE